MSISIPNVYNAFYELVSCPQEHFFKHFRNPRGDEFNGYCCDNYPDGPWLEYFDDTNAAHPEFPQNWVVKIQKDVEQWITGSGLAYGPLVDYTSDSLVAGSTNNEKGLVPALMKNQNNNNIELCCEAPFIQDRKNFKCCDATRYSISEQRCCPDLYYLENDKCFINALVPTGIAVGAVAAKAGIASLVMNQNNQAASSQAQAAQVAQIAQPQAAAIVAAPAPIIKAISQNSWAEPLMSICSAIILFAPFAVL